MIKEINGWHVLGAFVVGFGIIIGVNLTLAFKAVQTFPGLEVKNSYVASQQFQQNRSDQVALGWDVAATVSGDELRLEILQDGRAIAPQIEKAVFGRATHDNADQTPEGFGALNAGAVENVIAFLEGRPQFVVNP